MTDTHESHCENILVLLCVQTTAAAAVLAVDSSSKAVTIQLEALGLLAVAPLWTPTTQHNLFVCVHASFDLNRHWPQLLQASGSLS